MRRVLPLATIFFCSLSIANPKFQKPQHTGTVAGHMKAWQKRIFNRDADKLIPLPPTWEEIQESMNSFDPQRKFKNDTLGTSPEENFHKLLLNDSQGRIYLQYLRAKNNSQAGLSMDERAEISAAKDYLTLMYQGGRDSARALAREEGSVPRLRKIKMTLDSMVAGIKKKAKPIRLNEDMKAALSGILLGTSKIVGEQVKARLQQELAKEVGKLDPHLAKVAGWVSLGSVTTKDIRQIHEDIKKGEVDAETGFRIISAVLGVYEIGEQADAW